MERYQELFHLYVLSGELSKNVFFVLSHWPLIWLFRRGINDYIVIFTLLCMGCHPHTRVNPAQCMIRKETQEPMWLQAIYKILFQHNKEASNTRRENEE